VCDTLDERKAEKSMGQSGFSIRGTSKDLTLSSLTPQLKTDENVDDQRCDDRITDALEQYSTGFL
jgi:hypothetical protein